MGVYAFIIVTQAILALKKERLLHHLESASAKRKFPMQEDASELTFKFVQNCGKSSKPITQPES